MRTIYALMWFSMRNLTNIYHFASHKRNSKYFFINSLSSNTLGLLYSAYCLAANDPYSYFMRSVVSILLVTLVAIVSFCILS
jgi:hypothetical protein